MIKKKSPKEIDAMKKAGKLSAEVLRIVGQAIAPGVSTAELDELAERYIRRHGGTPAFKGYSGFPASICASINDQIVHGIPRPDVILREGDVISIDTGAVVNGWVGDNAWTYAVGEVSPELQHLLRAGEECLWKGIEQAQVGNHVGAIGHAVEQCAKRNGYSVVREYVGHGIGRQMHEDPDVPNYGRKGSGPLLEAGMVIAIEPMINAGKRKTVTGNDGWVVTTRDGKPSVHFEKTVAITNDGPLVLTREDDRLRPC